MNRLGNISKSTGSKTSKLFTQMRLILVTEAVKQSYAKRAEKIHKKAAKLSGSAQTEYVNEQLAKIDDAIMHTAVEMLLWIKLREPTPKFSLLTLVLSAEGILIGTFAISFLLCQFGFHLPLVWSLTVAFILMVLLRWFFRMFDRAFMFRRLFVASVTVGLILIGPAQFAFSIETKWGGVSWGGAPPPSLIIIWAICAVLSAAFAHNEYKKS